VLRRIVEWILYKLGIKKRKGAVEAIIDLLPIVLGIMVIVSAFRWLAADLPRPSLWQRMKYWFKYRLLRFRSIAIGY